MEGLFDPGTDRQNGIRAPLRAGLQDPAALGLSYLKYTGSVGARTALPK
jgi:hypothetical protein